MFHEEDLRFISNPELSNWECGLFGNDFNGGIIWNPIKGKVPNLFWRTMQYLVFGNKWRKIKK